MKISSVYLKDQIPGNFRKVARTDLINSDRFQKKKSSDNFGVTNIRLSKAYTRKGKSVNMEVMIGKKIDIRG